MQKNAQSITLNYFITCIVVFAAAPSQVIADCPDCNQTWCLKGDMDLNRAVEVSDVPGFIDAILTDSSDPIHRCSADTNVDDFLDGLDISGMVRAILSSDTDSDGIPDVYESNDGVVASPVSIGTDPDIADTDGDGLDDGDEVYCTADCLDLRAMGALPVRKDIFVEMDWVYKTGQAPDTNKPHANQIDRVAIAFANAPVANPDRSTGIQVHFDYGQGGVFTGGNSVEDPSGNDTVNVDEDSLDALEFAIIKDANFAVNRRGYFHYCVMCSKYSANGVYQNSSGVAELTGDDFLVSMGQWQTGDHDYIGNTIMHEMGHNIGLRHGGNENRNFKPNYNSVMNYWYQFCGNDTNGDVIPDGALDYSHGGYPELNENSLQEPDGVTGVGPAVNWNVDGDSTDLGVVRNINCRLSNTFANSPCMNHIQLNSACGSQGFCYDSACTLLKDFNDWNAIQLDHLDETGLIAPEVINCALGAAE